MATGRTVERWTRLYVDGYDLSGYGRSVGPLEVSYDEANLTTWTDQVKGYLRDLPHCNLGTLNTVFDNTATSGAHVVLGTAGQERVVLVAKGIRAAPAAGDPVFGGQFTQGAYQAAEEGKAITASIPFNGWARDAATLAYAAPFGVLLHALGAETGANTGTGVDDFGAATSNGGFMVCHITTSNAAGTATIKVQHADTNLDGSFADLGGCTTGAIGFASIPYAVIVPTTAMTTTVNRYLRWQLALAGGMTTVSFVLSFHRG